MRSTTLFKEFKKKATEIDLSRQRFDSAFSSKHIKSTDIENAYSGLFLDLFTSFEGFIDNLFIGLLSKDIKHISPSVKSTISIKPKSSTESVLLGGKYSYIDWLPYKQNTLRRAKVFFVNGEPFSKIHNSEMSKIGNYLILRNAIAHKSKKAQNEFSDLIKPLTLLPTERTPSGYLRNIPNPATGKTHFTLIQDDLISIAHSLSH